MVSIAVLTKTLKCLGINTHPCINIIYRCLFIYVYVYSLLMTIKIRGQKRHVLQLFYYERNQFRTHSNGILHYLIEPVCSMLLQTQISTWVFTVFLYFVCVNNFILKFKLETKGQMILNISLRKNMFANFMYQILGLQIQC